MHGHYRFLAMVKPSYQESEAVAGVNGCIADYYRCPAHYLKLAQRESNSEKRGYFRFGPDAICYGRFSGETAKTLPARLEDALSQVTVEGDTAYLPFNLSEVVENLRWERYLGETQTGRTGAAFRGLYYALRPLISFGLRSFLKRLHLRDWQGRQFPQWPVDRSVDAVMEQAMLLSVRASKTGRIPMIWFWPNGASACATVTHDVEESAGVDFCGPLMDIDDSFNIKSSFEIVPEERYQVTPQLLQTMTGRGFEVVVHDLNHDGHLYRSRDEFLRRARKINEYGKQFGAAGFRSAILNRKQAWFDALDFAYDMSVPNVAHLDPQRGGCCTVMPFFIGNLLEIPVTTTQDYMLFHVLRNYSIDLWKEQIRLIMEKFGLISFIVHPDYIVKDRERAVYESLLTHLCELRAKENLWIATPGEVNRWWRQRAEMNIREENGVVKIEGPGSERARIAYASEQDGRLVFSFTTNTDSNPRPVVPSSMSTRPQSRSTLMHA
jgi:hypothetical protein